MTSFERRQRILETLRTRPGLRVPELAELLSVSQGTVRNDLEALSRNGQLKRVHGGAALSEEDAPANPSFAARSRHNESLKRMIARQAAGQVEDGDSIYLDASSSVYFMTIYLKERRRLRVVTNGLEAGRALAANPANTVVLLGGQLNAEGSAISGPIAEQQLADLHVQKAFFSCSGFNLENGMTEVQIDEARLKKKAIASADAVYALVDSTKFGKVDLSSFARLEQITCLFSDSALPQAWIDQLRQSGLDFSLCAPETKESIRLD